ELDDLVVADRVGELVGARSGREIDVEDEIELEGLPDLGLMLHHAVIGVQREARNKDGVGHRASRMACATRNACTVSATSWVRTIAAPFSTATRWLTIEPPMRWSGGAGDNESMKRLREAPTRSGRAKDRSSPSRPTPNNPSPRLFSNPIPVP